MCYTTIKKILLHLHEDIVNPTIFTSLIIWSQLKNANLHGGYNALPKLFRHYLNNNATLQIHQNSRHMLNYLDWVFYAVSYNNELIYFFLMTHSNLYLFFF